MHFLCSFHEYDIKRCSKLEFSNGSPSNLLTADFLNFNKLSLRLNFCEKFHLKILSPLGTRIKICHSLVISTANSSFSKQDFDKLSITDKFPVFVLPAKTAKVHEKS